MERGAGDQSAAGAAKSAASNGRRASGAGGGGRRTAGRRGQLLRLERPLSLPVSLDIAVRGVAARHFDRTPEVRVREAPEHVWRVGGGGVGQCGQSVSVCLG